MLKGCPDWVKDTLSTSSGYPIDTISTLNSNLNSNLNVSSATQTEAVTSGKSKDTGDPLNRRIWVDGVELLTASGLTEKNARSFLGGLAKKHGQSALAEAIAVATVSNPVNADEWLVGRLKFRQNGNDKPVETLPTASENLKLQVIEGVKPPPNGHQIAA